MNNDKNFKEAKKMNTEALNKSSNFYDERMESVLNDNLIYTKAVFRKFHLDLEQETCELFSNICKYGEREFIDKYERILLQNIEKSKKKYKRIFNEIIENLKSKIDEVFKNSLKHYKDVMKTLLTLMPLDKNAIETKHRELKSKSIVSLKNVLDIKDEEFIAKQITKLKFLLDKEFNEIFFSRNVFEENVS
jgi:hypothetical protein